MVYHGLCVHCHTDKDDSQLPSIETIDTHKILSTITSPITTTTLPSTSISTSNSVKTLTNQKSIQFNYYDSSIKNVDLPPQICQLVPGLSLTTSKCEIPYYASDEISKTFQPIENNIDMSTPIINPDKLLIITTTTTSTSIRTTDKSSAAASSTSYYLTSIKNTRFYYFWTISWFLLLTLLMTKCYIAAWTSQIVDMSGQL